MATAKNPGKKSAAKKTAQPKTPRPPTQAQAAKAGAKTPAPPRGKGAKNTQSPPRRGTAPKARKSQAKTKPGGVMPPYQGSGPAAGGAMGYSGFGG